MERREEAEHEREERKQTNGKNACELEGCVLGEEGNKVAEGENGDGYEGCKGNEEGRRSCIPEKGGNVDEEKKEEEEFCFDGIGENEKDFCESERKGNVSSDGEKSSVVKESIGKKRRSSNLNVVMMERTEVKEIMENE